MTRILGLLVGQRLEHARLGQSVILGFSGDRQVVIETTAYLHRGDETLPVGRGDELTAVLGLLVSEAVVAPGGELRITFGGGSVLVAGADEEYESWAVMGPPGFLIVCQPGGDLAGWGDAAPAAAPSPATVPAVGEGGAPAGPEGPGDAGGDGGGGAGRAPSPPAMPR
ncbi:MULTISPECIES: DUF6188 family protein [Actinoplanes]|uniref:DUF6188 family protein n=1 Tax=Actinoplanes TaxID=1865 RepID=UPI0012FA2139|nr:MULTISPECIES: DUF6188 family protein [Actinoplanes]